MAELFTSENLIALLTLSSLEIVLGIDNIVFISILVGKLPREQQAKARQIGLLLAMGMRIVLLLAISWVMGLTAPLFAPFGHAFSGRDLILLIGGLFLIAKATWEIHDKLEGGEHGAATPRAASFGAILFQIVLLDIVFSLESVLTAIGMANDISIMIAAVVIAVGVMLFAAKPISDFVNRHPTIKMLAFSFLILVGVVLIADASHRHIPKGYIYFAMAFSIGVEMLNLRLRKTGTPVHLHQ